MSTKKRNLNELIKAKSDIGNIGALDFLIKREIQGSTPITYTPFLSKNIEIPKNIDNYKTPPKSLPTEIEIPSPKGTANDYTHLLSQIDEDSQVNLSVIVLTYNRDSPLEKTLLGLIHQEYPIEKIEIIVVDDGSKTNTIDIIRRFSNKVKIKYFWHPDIGFTPSIARNAGVNLCQNNFVILLDVDMYPDKNLIKNYAKHHKIINQATLIGPRKYVDLTNVEATQIEKNPDLVSQLDTIITNNKVAGAVEDGKSVDWRLNTIHSTDYLKKEKLPFRMFAAGNVAFSKSEFLKIGGFDERFRNWGFEDGELAFRLFNNGHYMIPILDAWAYHQEPEGGENETDRAAGKSVSATHYSDVCPYYRHLTTQRPIYITPKVSIYIPAFNAEKTIIDAVESALRQRYEDLEVCICDDGSTDSTFDLLEKYYKNNPRVRYVKQANGGIGAASNTAVKMTRGLYIGQLDSDDILAVDAVENAVPFFEKDMTVGLVYATYENEMQDGTILPGYNYPIFTREKFITAMIVHHFRMFRRRDWARTGGFSERLKNAVDYDFYLKLVEKCNVVHINKIAYRRRLHGGNTSIVDNTQQNLNAAKAVTAALHRQGISFSAYVPSPDKPTIEFTKS